MNFEEFYIGSVKIKPDQDRELRLHTGIGKLDKFDNKNAQSWFNPTPIQTPKIQVETVRPKNISSRSLNVNNVEAGVIIKEYLSKLNLPKADKDYEAKFVVLYLREDRSIVGHYVNKDSSLKNLIHPAIEFQVNDIFIIDLNRSLYVLEGYYRPGDYVWVDFGRGTYQSVKRSKLYIYGVAALKGNGIEIKKAN